MKLNEGKIFYCSKFNVKIYYLIMFVLCSLFRRLFPFIIELSDFGKPEEPNFNKSCLFDMMSNISGDLLVGLYKIYEWLSNKHNKIQKNRLIEKSENREEYSTIDPKKEEIKKYQIEQKDEMKNNFILIMIIIAVIDTIAQLSLLIFSYYDTDGSTLGFLNNSSQKINEDDLIFTVAINIIFIYFFSRLFLTIYISFHNKVSLIITFISFIPLFIVIYFKTLKSSQELEVITYIILNIFMTILYAFEDVMNKVALTKLVIRPYELVFYKSLFQLPLFIVTFVIVMLLDKYNPNGDTKSLSDYLKGNRSKLVGRIIYRFSFIISNIFRTLSLISVIEILSPNDLFILKALEYVVLSLFSMSKNSIDDFSDFMYFLIELLCCILILIASCISNEIFIINRCNLAKETNYFKSEKGDKIDEEINGLERINENEDSIN